MLHTKTPEGDFHIRETNNGLRVKAATEVAPAQGTTATAKGGSEAVTGEGVVEEVYLVEVEESSTMYRFTPQQTTAQNL